MESQTMKSILLVLLLTAPAFSLPNLEFDVDEQMQRIVRSDDVDGYTFATLHAADTATNEDRGQTKRDLEALAADPSSGQRSFSFLMTSGERLRMSLSRQRSIDTSQTTFSTLTEEGEKEFTFKQRRDCYFGGDLEGEEGTAFLSMCGGEVVGNVKTSKRTYEVHSLPVSAEKADNAESGDVVRVLLTWQDGERGRRALQDGLVIPGFDDDNVTEPTVKRTVADRKVTIEIADFVDKYFIKNMGKSDEKIIEFILFKWAQAYAALKNSKAIGWDITLKLVGLTLWKTSPSWYSTSAYNDLLYERLEMACRGTSSGKYDQVTLHTGDTFDGLERLGIAWVGGLCMKYFRCSAVISTKRGSNTELHEFGHSIGLKHDSEMKTEYNCDPKNAGFMGYNYEFRQCYKAPLDTFFKSNSASCAYRNDFSKAEKIFT